VSSNLEILDPGDPVVRASAALRSWAALQIELALAPEAAVDALDATGDPLRAMALLRPAARVAAARLDRALDALARAGAVLVPFSSPAYPWRLSQIRDPAPVLSVIGDRSALEAPAVAIVGARAATVYGLAAARQLAGDLARAGVVVVSGLARGIDAAAHEAALEAGGRTVAVQACGPDLVYPRAHRSLAERIARQGALVTELPPGMPPRRQHFPLRNRLISGLCRGLVVVEARERSGSLVSAQHALSQGIDVFAVPGPITAPTSVGPNRLLRDGALPVLEAGDVLDLLGLVAPHNGGGLRSSGAARPPHAAPALAPGLRAIVQALQRCPATRDELARSLGRSGASLALELLELELSGLVQIDRDGRLRAVR
jgi:DNA processing protein